MTGGVTGLGVTRLAVSPVERSVHSERHIIKSWAWLGKGIREGHMEACKRHDRFKNCCARFLQDDSTWA